MHFIDSRIKEISEITSRVSEINSNRLGNPHHLKERCFFPCTFMLALFGRRVMVTCLSRYSITAICVHIVLFYQDAFYIKIIWDIPSKVCDFMKVF